jgi:hypothetical protein
MTSRCGTRGSLILTCALLLFTRESGRAQEELLRFSGNLERVGEHSISVKLKDRRVIDAMLPASEGIASESRSGKYSMGDEVEIVCRPIEPVWEEATGRVQSIELISMRLLRKASLQEVRNMLEARPREGFNLLERPEGAEPEHARVYLKGPGAQELERARKVNLDYLTRTPNFVADEIAKRYRSGGSSERVRPYDTVESEIAFRGRRVIRTQIRRNGEPWTQPFDSLPGYKWYEGFDSEIGPIFDPTCPTEIQYHGRTSRNGRAVLQYNFTSPVDGCFPFLYFTYQRYNPARTGSIVVEDPAGDLLEVEDRCEKFPSGFEFQSRVEHVTRDYVRIGESTHLLPVRADFAVSYRDGTRYRVEVQYRNHRHFESSSNITFQ